jgi:SAM-dependent methyltransferase
MVRNGASQPAGSADVHGPEVWPTEPELAAHFDAKHGPRKGRGWSSKQRGRAGYYLPAEFYDAVVARLVTAGCQWLDVGGGRDIFPENRPLASRLVARAGRVVAVDPSPNVRENRVVTETVCLALEDYHPAEVFDLATVRMVVEHVTRPAAFVAALSRLVRPGGCVVVFTVDERAPLSRLARTVPFWLHHPIKFVVWGGPREQTFPVHYLLNSRAALAEAFDRGGFTERAFGQLDDLSATGRFWGLSWLDLQVWKALRRRGRPYPEQCLLGVYERRADPST